MSAGGGQSTKINSVSPHGFLYTTRANTSHERIEQIRVCAGSTPAYKGVAGVYEVCTLTEEKAGTLPIGMAQSKVEQTTRALEPALLPLPAIGRFTRYVRTGGYILFALWQSGN